MIQALGDFRIPLPLGFRTFVSEHGVIVHDHGDSPSEGNLGMQQGNIASLFFSRDHHRRLQEG